MSVRFQETVAPLLALPFAYHGKLREAGFSSPIAVALIVRSHGFWALTARQPDQPEVSLILDRGSVKNLFITQARFIRIMEGTDSGTN